MTKENYIVIEGIHKDPNNYNTMHNSSRKVYGPLNETKAKELAMMLNQKNVDNFNHRAWVIKESIRGSYCGLVITSYSFNRNFNVI